eukprot:CAMPEP_0194763860 /NCGR_PEP_ID=MMETSP0323_2-20130528/20656_1 /TAXON_ID=2866 ORGANISM="Crypthecodinium cohnii, Strain Seligo" /NCGR_SAMPLE_ID=MMETSP0323_2 /ASSEMBLY_ACC=CAM_ASM_000346 /LENGTH=334 /DNA_ID=CAMNT_0039689723 /DNA_START=70 /DNA_END=1074 /DNA_ORIENTATION=-
MMKGVAVQAPGGVDMLQVVSDIPRPSIKGENEVLIKVMCTAVNRADTMQRMGMYPPPPGASDIIGLEASGVIESVGPAVKRWQPGDKVMALLAGGGYAEYAVVHEGSCMPIPEGFSFEEAAAIPEVFLTAFQAMTFQANFEKGKTLLVHAGASGIGTAACQLARFMGGRSITTSSASKVEACKKFADFAVSREPGKDGKLFASKIAEEVGPNCVDVIIDPVVTGGYLEENAEIMNLDGQIVVLAFLNGPTIKDFNCLPIFKKRGGIKFSTLRSQSEEYKASLVSRFSEVALPGFKDGRLKPVIDKVMPLEDIAKAHSLIEASTTIGKIILQVQQ